MQMHIAQVFACKLTSAASSKYSLALACSANSDSLTSLSASVPSLPLNSGSSCCCACCCFCDSLMSVAACCFGCLRCFFASISRNVSLSSASWSSSDPLSLSPDVSAPFSTVGTESCAWLFAGAASMLLFADAEAATEPVSAALSCACRSIEMRLVTVRLQLAAINHCH